MPPASGSILVLALLAAVSPAQSKPSAPPLPVVVLETFPPAAREAVSRLYKEASARPADAGAAGALGRMLHAWEQWDSAHQAYERAAALAPSDFDWTYLDAVVLQRLARYDGAASALRRALAARPDYLAARLKLAEVLLEAGDLAQSEQLFAPLTAIPAAEPAAQVGLGRINAARGRHEEAIRHFERALAAVSRAWRRSLRAGPSLPRGRPNGRRRARGRGARSLRPALAASRRSGAGLSHLAARGCPRHPGPRRQPG